MPEPSLRDRLALVRTVIAERQARGGWQHPVQVLAVTKTHPATVVREAVAAGLTAVGENRVQEALHKQAECEGLAVDWHLIGGLQRNKVRQAVGRFAWIHSVDREELAADIARRVPPGQQQAVLVQVNCSAEPQKGGVEPAGLPGLLDHLRDLAGLRVLGLMTMAAWDAEEGAQRATFARLRTLRDRMATEGHHLPELSMGMSGDYPAAVEEGATCIRLGSVLFGDRST